MSLNTFRSSRLLTKLLAVLENFFHSSKTPFSRMPPKKSAKVAPKKSDTSKKRIEELLTFLKKHKKLYDEGKEEVGDPEYDEAFYELQELDPNHPFLDALGEADGEDYGDFVKKPHKIFMHSQQKARNLQEFATWFNKLPKKCSVFRVDYKLDGSSIELVYEDGVLTEALTQGEKEGYDIYEHAKQMKFVPLRVTDPEGYPFTGSLRGEMVMDVNTFKKKYRDKYLDEQGEAIGPGGRDYTNIRATAIGISKKGGPGLKDVQIILYDSSYPFTTYSEDYDFLSSIKGAKVVESWTYDRTDALEGISEWYDNLTEKRTNEDLPIEIDGLVVRCDQIDVEDNLRKKPNFQIAIKFPPQSKITKILDIKWMQQGATFTPLAILEPIELCSTIVRKATLHNYAKVLELEASKGAMALVSKRGDIIPKVEKITTKSSLPPASPPVKCPSCGTKLKINKNKSRVTCPNLGCPALILHRIARWISVLDVKYFGKKMIRTYVENAKPSYLYEIYEIDAKYLAGLQSEGGKKIGLSMANKVVANLKKASEDLPLENFLGALDIYSTGTRIFKLLVDAGYTLETIREASEDDLVEVKGIGPKRATLIVNGLYYLSDDIDGLLEYVTIAEPVFKEDLGEDVEEKGSVCFTGKLSLPRGKMEAFARECGFEIKSGVSKGLTYLVAADADSGSAKNKKATSLGVKVIDEDTFRKMC